MSLPSSTTRSPAIQPADYLDSQAEHVLDEAKSSVLNFLEQFKLPAPPPEPSPPDPAILEKLATGIEELTEAISGQLRAKAEEVRNESASAPVNHADETSCD